MAFQNFYQDLLSDLVAHEPRPYDGYARRVINVTTTTDLKHGTVVYRPINRVDQTAPYAPVTPANATAALVEDNELAVVFGDKLKSRELIPASTTGDTPMVAFVRGEVFLKDYLLMENSGITDRASAEYKALKAILETQGVLIETTLAHVPAGL